MTRVFGAWLVAALLLGRPSAARAEDAAADGEVIEVIVEAAPTEQQRDPTPASYVLRDDELGRAGIGLSDALDRVPGVQLRRSGSVADPAAASIRGATGAQTPVYLAGVRLNDELTGGANLATVPVWMLHRAEVYRGNAPAYADELGIAGAIVLEPRLPRGSEALASWEVGSFDERALSGAISLGDGDAAAMTAVRLARSDGDFPFLDDGGTRFDTSDDVVRRRVNADYRDVDVWTAARTRLGRGSLQLVLNAFVREQGAPGLQARSAKRARARVTRGLGGLRSQLPCGAWGCTLSIEAGATSTRYLLSDPERELGLASETHNDGDSASQRMRVGWSPTSWLRTTLGLGQRLGGLRVDADRQALQRARRHVLRPDVDARVRVGRMLTLVGAGALECHSTTSQHADPGAAASQEGACGVLEPVGRVGAVVVPLDPLALRANVGRYVRVPTLGELYGLSSALRGNASLAVERGWTADLGVTPRLQTDSLSLWGQLFGFARWADELISYRRSSIGTVTPYNAASARVLGAELAVGVGLWRIVYASLALTLTDPRDTSAERLVDRDLLPLSSRLVAAPELELRSPPWRRIALDRASLTVRYRHRSSRVADPAGLIVLAADNQVDVDVALHFAGRASWRLRLANLLDRPSYDILGYPLPGRSIHGLMEVRL